MNITLFIGTKESKKTLSDAVYDRKTYSSAQTVFLMGEGNSMILCRKLVFPLISRFSLLPLSPTSTRFIALDAAGTFMRAHICIFSSLFQAHAIPR